MKFIDTGKWVVSEDGVGFFDDEYPTAEDAERACIGYNVGSYIGKKVKIVFTQADITLRLLGLLDELNYALYDEIGDAADLWEISPAVKLDLTNKLAEFVIDYMEELNLQPKPFKVSHIKEVKK